MNHESVTLRIFQLLWLATLYAIAPFARLGVPARGNYFLSRHTSLAAHQMKYSPSILSENIVANNGIVCMDIGTKH